MWGFIPSLGKLGEIFLFVSLGSGSGVLEDSDGEVSNPLFPVQQLSGKVECVTAFQAAPSPSSDLFSPRAVVSTQGTVTMPKSLRYCYPRDSRLWIQNTTLSSSVLASLVASSFCRITSHCLHEEQFLQNYLNNCLSGDVNRHFQSNIDTRS